MKPADKQNTLEIPVPTPRILLVDDDPFVRELLMEVLMDQGYEVDTADDGKHALEQLDACGGHDLVISDMNMPRMNGLELIRALKERNATIPIIILTSNDAIGTVIESMHSGADDYLLKDENIYETIGFSVTKVFGRQDLIKQNLRMLDEIKQQNQRLSKINDITEEINNELDFKKLLGSIVQVIQKLTGCSKAMALVMNRDVGCFEARYLNGWSDHQTVTCTGAQLRAQLIDGADLLMGGIYSKQTNIDHWIDQDHAPSKPSTVFTLHLQTGDGDGIFVFQHDRDDVVLSQDGQEMIHDLYHHFSSAFQKSKLLYQLQSLNQKLETFSMTDPLTGLNNRRFVTKNIGHDIAMVARSYHYRQKDQTVQNENRDLLFLLVDIDHFKWVNDTHGHAAGDLVLSQFSDILKESCRDSDMIIRWGGEEFLLICRQSSHPFGKVIAERIRSSVEAFSFTIDGGTRVKRTCSIGFACYPLSPVLVDHVRWEQVVDLADKALYAAKRSGRNCWVSLTIGDSSNKDLFTELNHEGIASLIEKGKIGAESSLEAPSSINWEG